MMNLSEYRTKSARLADFLPWVCLVAEGVVLNKDGAFQRTARFRGPDLDSATPAELVAVTARLTSALRRLGSGWAIFVEAVRRPAQDYPESDFPDPASALVERERAAQFAEEGAAKVFKPMIGSGYIVGVVGALQFDVLASRIEQEYQLPVRFEGSNFTSARWVSGPKAEVERFINVNKGHIATDHDGDVVFLTRLQWDIDRIQRDYPELKLTATKDMMV